MTQYLKRLMYLLTKKKIDESKLSVIEISANSDDLRYFNLSSNSIISLDYNGETYYFRECPKLCGVFDYVRNSTDSFFLSLNKKTISKEHFAQKLPIQITFENEIVVDFKKYVDKKLNCKNAFKILSSVDKISESIGFSIWENTDFTAEFFTSFGFSDISESLKDIAVYYLWYLRGAMYNFRTMKYIKGKTHSFFNASKAMASRAVAEVMGVESLITDTSWCRIILEDNRVLFGVLSKAAKGTRMSDTKVALSGRLQRELNILNLLDVICFQKDHGPNNYNVTEDGGVCAFDNDNPTTFMPIPSVSVSLSGCSPYFDKSGRVLRPFADKDFVEILKNIDMQKLVLSLKPYLNSVQISALKKRIKKINIAISKAVDDNTLKLLSGEQWNADTSEEELKLKDINTYYTNAINT